MSDRLPLPLDRPAIHIDVEPGGEIILRGSVYSRHDGSRIDAATTAWPEGAPGGGSVDQGGLIDFESGGFHLTSRDPVTHEVHAIATGSDAPACTLVAVQSPCLPLRLPVQARSRLMETREWISSLSGGVQFEVVQPPAAVVVSRAAPALIGPIATVCVIAAVVGAWLLVRKRARSPRGQLIALARKVQDRARQADPVLSASLRPALNAALQAVRGRRIDPGSVEGKRVSQVLQRVDQMLESDQNKSRESQERKAADELVREVEIALESAQEASRIGAARR